MGVRGAALATILSQLISAIWILKFLTGPKAILKLKKNCMKLKRSRVCVSLALEWAALPCPLSNSSVQVMYNAMLQKTGGDLYVGIMTVINTVREVISMPGSRALHTVPSRSWAIIMVQKNMDVWKRLLCLYLPYLFYIPLECGLSSIPFPGFFIRIFNSNGDLVDAGIPASVFISSAFSWWLSSLQASLFLLALEKRRMQCFSLSSAKWSL